MKSVSKLLTALALAISLQANAQINEKQWAQIDSLFIAWNRPDHPGGAIAVMQGDQLVFSKAYGLASMEYLVPNTTGTQFNVASVSKQFSALGIVKLHLEGKLSIDDTIDRYIEGLAPFGQQVTIRQMLHHTSGLRSLHALFGLAGWRNDDTRTNEDVDRIMAKQQELNFEPGSEYMYCNTGYMFLANIIEKVTGRSFVAYMREEVFEPLGMTDTYVEADYDHIVPNNATSYYRRTEGFARAVEYWGYVGSGNMHTTTMDLISYLKNYYDPLPGWKPAFDMMQTLDPLNDGSHNQYALGVNVDELLGEKRIGHGGSIGGFRSNISVFPEKRTSIAIVTNFSTAAPADKSERIASIVFGKTPRQKDLRAVELTREQKNAYTGTFWDDTTYTEERITLEGDTLFMGNKAFLPIKSDEFSALAEGDDDRITFDREKMTYYPASGSPKVFSKLEKGASKLTTGAEYAGSYYSPELETTYTIHYENGTWYAHHIRHGKLPLELRKNDLLKGRYPLSNIRIQRKNGKITGAHISNGRVRNLWFTKTE
ncbi:serine hydrolase domain-containing protein [Flagellimonas okinawensis]|uniref:Serine hydrolase n=1 Tax=Flagellimonas okinawensis TaxID=3031324 RepID=A0ABT5XQY8_9FLAO|nr:serine hydrolase domain-containing protein [[Muricauda] okinawensis]MDF0708294.1 serine hydrolase [[Muricauda] okinawensis]